jgi:hypothetical protein
VNENKAKRYFWNSSAETHANAVFAVAVLSVGVAGIVSLVAGAGVFYLYDLTRLDAFLVVVGMCLCWLVMWATMFLVTIGYYFKLIESQVINPPTNKVIHEKRTFYQTGDKQFKQHK